MGLQEVRVDLSDTVDGVRAHNAQVGHVDTLDAVLLNQRHASHLVVVAGEASLDVLQVSEVYLVDDLQVTGQESAQAAHGPSLQGLLHERVVGVGARAHRDVPRLLPGQALVVDQDTHELRDGERRMRVVELNGHLVREVAEVVAGDFARAELGGLEATDDVLESGRAQEVLLLDAQVLALGHIVVRVQHAGDVLGVVAIAHGLDVVTVVEES